MQDLIRLTNLGTMKNTPTFFPDPYSAGMHEELHRAIQNDIGKIQGPWQRGPRMIYSMRTTII